MSKVENNDYQLAKDIIDTMGLHEETNVTPTKLSNFRKYLREIVWKRKGQQQFATRDEMDKVKIIRIR